MTESTPLSLPVVDGLELAPNLRGVLRPGQLLRDREGRLRRLPRYFYEVGSWSEARELPVAPHFMLWEFIAVDVRESARQLRFPRYVPCTLPLLAAHLEVLREAVGTYVHIAANGGYRTPAHELSRYASTHCWATAANIYRIGDEYLDTRDRIERYTDAVRRTLPGAWVRPWGSEDGLADDHLHVDIGYAVLTPRGAASEQP